MSNQPQPSHHDCPDPVTDPDGWYRHFYAVNAAHLAARAADQARRGQLAANPTNDGAPPVFDGPPRVTAGGRIETSPETSPGDPSD